MTLKSLIKDRLFAISLILLTVLIIELVCCVILNVPSDSYVLIVFIVVGCIIYVRSIFSFFGRVLRVNMENHYVKIEKFQCKYCKEEFISEVDAKDHIEFTKHCNDGLVYEPIPDDLKVIRVKHRHQKTYSLAKVEGFSYDYCHRVEIYLDRWCYNRDNDHFPENETSNQCSLREIVTTEELKEYTLDQVTDSLIPLTEDMVS